jgi:predicted Zn-dependent peptidase
MTRIHLAFVALLCATTAVADTAAPVKDPIADFPKRVHKITLENGLRAVVVERPDSPTVSFVTYIRTGGIDDPMGESGLAHMFEHMLFKGTQTIGTRDYKKEVKILDDQDRVQEQIQAEKDKGAKSDAAKLKSLQEKFAALEKEHAKILDEEAFWKIYERAGAQDMNASTGYDYTDYIVSLPVAHLPLWFAMEADRVAHPVLREFYKERSVVMEERRMRFDNSPEGRMWEAFLAAAFVAHPYGRPVVGWESDISRVTRADAQRFFRNNYDVSRLVVGIVGGVKADDVEKRLRTAFGGLKSAPSTEVHRIPVEPKQEGERRVTVLYDAEPSVLIGYHRPDMKSPDEAALSVLESILGEGRTSRLNRALVERQRVAVNAWADASSPGQRDPCLFTLGGEPRSPHTAAEVEQAIYAEIEKIQKDGPTEVELARVKTNLENSVIRSMAGNAGLAGELAYFEAVAGDWHYVMDLIQGIRSVTAADVSRVARTYLTPENRTVAVLVRKK